MSREFLKEFILIFKSEPCLWQVSSKDYHNRNKKEAAYGKLVGKYREFDPNATKYDVISKINNMRSAIRKEKKKIKGSVGSGSSEHSAYKPKLWYFDLLSFLSDQDGTQTPGLNVNIDKNEKSTLESGVSKTQEMEDQDEHLTIHVSAPTKTPMFQKRSIDGKVESDEKGRSLKEGNDHFKKPRIEEDRFDVIGKGFAIKLRGLPKDQMLLAEKIMNDALFQAEMGTLTISHRLVGESQSCQISCSSTSNQGTAPSGSSSVSCNILSEHPKIT